SIRSGRQSNSNEPDLNATIRTLITEHADPARVLELYYWSQEPALLEIIRGVMALPRVPRETLKTFLALARNPHLIQVSVDEFGRLMLCSQTATQPLPMVRKEQKKQTATA